MRKRIILIGSVLTGLLVIVACLLLAAYQATQHVPTFYAEALALDATREADASHELGTRVTTLYNDARRSGDWQALFTSEQINGWLAVDLVQNHGQMIPDGVHEPRVKISPEMITLGLRYEEDNLSTVFSLGVEAYLHEPNLVALRIRKVRAGALPLPLTKVLDEISKAARQLEVPLRWSQVDGDPVALLSIEPGRDKDDNLLWLDRLELHEGEIYVAGRTVPGDPSDKSEVARQSDEQTKRQR